MVSRYIADAGLADIDHGLFFRRRKCGKGLGLVGAGKCLANCALLDSDIDLLEVTASAGGTA